MSPETTKTEKVHDDIAIISCRGDRDCVGTITEFQALQWSWTQGRENCSSWNTKGGTISRIMECLKSSIQPNCTAFCQETTRAPSKRLVIVQSDANTRLFKWMFHRARMIYLVMLQYIGELWQLLTCLRMLMLYMMWSHPTSRTLPQNSPESQ